MVERDILLHLALKRYAVLPVFIEIFDDKSPSTHLILEIFEYNCTREKAVVVVRFSTTFYLVIYSRMMKRARKI